MIVSTLPSQRRGERGTAAVEAVFALPLLAVLLVGTLDFARVFYAAMAVDHATRAGAVYGAQSSSKARQTSTMQTTAAAAAADISGFAATAYEPGSSTNRCMCYNTTTYTESQMAAGSCAAASCTTGVVREYAWITGSATFSTLSYYPGVPHVLTISRTVVLPVK